MSDPKPSAQRIDRYEIRRVLGTGAMGSVYAAWDPKLCREVALKVVPAHLARDPKARARFLREARAIAAVRHPNILEIYDYSGTDSSHLYLVIEKLEGQDLFAALTRSGAMPEAIALSIAHELCLALEVAHGAGIVHRDIKPENIFVSERGRVVLTDFGIVKAITKRSAIEGFKEPTEVIGTPGFMAPEQLTAQALTPGVDIFALGALLYNITTCQMPFSGSTPIDIVKAAQTGHIPDPRLVNPRLSAEFAALVSGCLRANPKDRPASAAVLRQECRRLLAEQAVGDLREEVRAFVGDPRAYRRMEHQRTLARSLMLYKVAMQDGDRAAAERHRLRLALLAPEHGEVRRILVASELLSEATVVETSSEQAAAHQPLEIVPWQAPPRWQASWRKMVRGMGLAVALAALLGGGAAAWRRLSEDAERAPLRLAIVRPLPPARRAAAQPASVDVAFTVSGPIAGLRLDGRPLVLAPRRHLRLRAGEHAIELLAGKAWLQQRFTLVAGSTGAEVHLDAARGELAVWAG